MPSDLQRWREAPVHRSVKPSDQLQRAVQRAVQPTGISEQKTPQSFDTDALTLHKCCAMSVSTKKWHEQQPIAQRAYRARPQREKPAALGSVRGLLRVHGRTTPLAHRSMRVHHRTLAHFITHQYALQERFLARLAGEPRLVLLAAVTAGRRVHADLRDARR